MTYGNPRVRSLDSIAWHQLERVVEQFERAWEQGSRPTLEDMLPVDSTIRSALVLELAHAELEYRIRAGEPARAEDYLQKYSELRDDSAAALDLIHTEFRLRSEQEPHVSIDEYLSRFPQHDSELRRRLLDPGASAQPTPAGDATTHDSMQTKPGLPDSSSPRFGAMPRVRLRRPPGETAFPGPGRPVSSPEFAGRCAILDELGRGGMGAVLKGHDPELGRDLAVKVLLEKYQDQSDMVRRFLVEAQVAGQLQHPGIVPVYDVGLLLDRRPFFTMKLVRGRTLAHLLADRAGPAEDLPRFLKIFEQVCQTLAYAHARGVIHRDLKPANVMVGAFGEVQVMDWGLAKMLDPVSVDREPTACAGGAGDTGVESRAGSVVGTPAYMPPEQARGEVARLDEHCDVFGLGAILCEILTGQPPYAAQSRRELLRKAEEGETADAYARLDACGADGDLLRLAKACLAVPMEDRLRDAGIVAREMTAYLANVQEKLRAAEVERAAAQAKAEEAKAKAAAERHARRLTMGLGAVILAGVVVIGGGGGWWLRQRAERDRAAEADLSAAEKLVEEGLLIEAQQAAERAKGRLGEGGSEPLRQRMEQLQGNLKVVAALEHVRIDQAALKEDRFDSQSANTGYRKAFRQQGLNVEEDDPAETATRIRSSPIKNQLLAALDHWAGVKQTYQMGGHERLREAANLADDSGWRRQIRQALEAKDQKAVRQLTKESGATDLPPPTVVRLAEVLTAGEALDDALAVLVAGLRRHPDDFWLNHELATLLVRVEPPRQQDAVAYYRAALALKPNSPGARLNLGIALIDLKRPTEAAEEFRETLKIQEDYSAAYNCLGMALHDQGKLTEAMEEYGNALRCNENDADAHNNMGTTYYEMGQPDKAEEKFREALRLRKRYPKAHFNLGNALFAQGKDAEAIDEYRTALGLQKNFPNAHVNLGEVFRKQRKFAEAEAEYRKALADKRDYPSAHLCLGEVYREQRKFDEAIDEFRKALRAQEDYPEVRVAWGKALMAQGKLAEGEEQYREAIRLKEEYPEAHLGLAFALHLQGRYSEAVAGFRRGHELGSARADWKRPSADWLKESERLAKLDTALAGYLKGKTQLTGSAEALDLARFSLQYKKYYAAAARLFGEAFAAEPALSNDLKTQDRYNAACAAALAAAGKGGNGKSLREEERTRLRRQSLVWLQDDLAAWTKTVDESPAASRPTAQRTLQHWQRDPDLAGVREPTAIAGLPSEEQQAWRKLWSDVKVLAQKAGEGL
jgi:serine/threonine-protein kinase